MRFKALPSDELMNLFSRRLRENIEFLRREPPSVESSRREEIVRIYTGDVAVNALKESIESARREIIVASTQGDNFWLMIGSGGFARFHREFLDFYKTEGKKDYES